MKCKRIAMQIGLVLLLRNWKVLGASKIFLFGERRKFPVCSYRKKKDTKIKIALKKN